MDNSNKKINDDAVLVQRRRILTGAATGSVVVTSSAVLPTSWSTPVLNAVITPSHATMSDTVVGADDDTVIPPEPVVGVFISVDIAIPAGNAGLDQVNDSEFSLLDMLVPNVLANDDLPGDFCDDDGFSAGNFGLLFDLNGDGSVNIALTGLATLSPITEITCGGTTTADVDNNIADTTLDIGSDTNGNAGELALTDMVATGTEITGTWTLTGGLCSTTFSAALSTDSFPFTESCATRRTTIIPTG